jgi:hypothetical protein
MRGSASGYIVYYDEAVRGFREFVTPAVRGEFPKVLHACCLATETREDMRKHLAFWMPTARFIGAIIVPDEEGK